MRELIERLKTRISQLRPHVLNGEGNVKPYHPMRAEYELLRDCLVEFEAIQIMEDHASEGF
jgi:hypothetical protein